jgi:hypothetical protein
MTQPAIDVLTAPRLPQLWREICAYGGLPNEQPPVPDRSFVIRCGVESPELLTLLLAEALAADRLEVASHTAAGEPDYPALLPGQVLVRPGYDSPCPDAFRQALHEVAELGSLLVFAIEERDRQGALRQVTWVGMPDELLPDVPLAAAVVRQQFAAAAGAPRP